MCGVWGTYHQTSMDHQQRQILVDMIRVGVVRGTQGTGIIGIDHKHNLNWRKVGGEPYLLQWTEGFEEFFKKVLHDSRYIFGHHRAATKGSVSDDNAHPFQHGHITLVHNGTLSGGVQLENDQVDSDALCKLVADKGAHHAFGKISGPYTCIWWDAKQERLNFITNGGRPLSIWKARGNHYWASEAGMLEWLLKRYYTTIDDKDILKYDIKPNVIYFFDGKDMLQKELSPVKKHWETSNNNNNNNSKGNNYRGHQTFLYPNNTQQTTVNNSPAPSEPPVKKDFLADFYLLSEEMKTYASGVTKWKYLGISDQNENIVVFLDEPLSTGFGNIHWHGQLKYPPRMNYSKLIDETQEENVVFYDVEPRSLIELLEPSPEEEKKGRYNTRDGHPLSKNKMKRFIKEGCITCRGMILEGEVSRCLAFTSHEGDPKALFCVRCSDAAVKRAEKSKSNVIALPNS